MVAFQMNTSKEILEKSIQKLEKWIEDHDYKGYEPFDGLSSFLRPFTFRNKLAERILQQTVRQSPFNLRPLFGIKPQESTKGRGFIVHGYLNMLKRTGDNQYKQKAINSLDWLIENKSDQYTNHSWGNHFDYASRSGKLRMFEPTIVWTSLIGQAFLDAYEILGDERFLEIAISVCDWILDVPREGTDSGACLNYTARNSNMLGAAMLARTSKYYNNPDTLKVAKEAMEYSCSRQLSNGAWYYGEAAKYHWIDNFHTGYNLDSLKCYIDNAKDKTFEKNLSIGFKFFKNNYFEDNGLPKYYHNRAYPLDIQCASQAIDTLAYFSEYDESSLEMSLKVAKWTIDNMQDKSGYFYYRILPLKKVKAPMIHWGQATMYKALIHLLSKI
jgi:hypothetical protein